MEEQFEKVFQKLDDLTSVVKTQSDFMSEVRHEITSLKGAHSSFQEALNALEKRVADVTIIGSSGFVQKVSDDANAQSSTKRTVEDMDLTCHVPAGQSTPEIRKNSITHPSKLVEQLPTGSLSACNEVTGYREREGLSEKDVQKVHYHCPTDTDSRCWPRTPTDYDGKIPWSQYELHFEAIAETNGWGDKLRSLQLASSLRGIALAYYETLSLETRRSYSRLRSAFAIRFGAENQQPASHILLRNRVQRSGESFSEFVTDLQRLARLKFANSSESSRDEIALEYFLDGIIDMEVQQMVRNFDPHTLEEEVRTANRIEANHRASRAAIRNIRVAVASIPARSTRRRAANQSTSRVTGIDHVETSSALNTSGNANELAQPKLGAPTTSPRTFPEQAPTRLINFQKLQGTVRWFDMSCGFGFITRNDNNGDVFLYITYLKTRNSSNQTSLSVGDKVEFDLFEGTPTHKAVNVSIKSNFNPVHCDPDASQTCSPWAQQQNLCHSPSQNPTHLHQPSNPLAYDASELQLSHLNQCPLIPGSKDQPNL